MKAGRYRLSPPAVSFTGVKPAGCATVATQRRQAAPRHAVGANRLIRTIAFDEQLAWRNLIG
jgi:hypothetical protein